MEIKVRDTVLYYCPSVASSVKNSSKKAVIICPGGSYHHLGMGYEGFMTAKWFNSIGYDAFVLRYRVAYNGHHHPSQLEDIQMAIHHVRSNNDKYGIDKNKLGVIGFSAGGHLVTMAGAFSSQDQLTKLGINVSESLRPDFVVPVYPVVSMDSDIGHGWSRKSLLGSKKDIQSYRDALSMEKNIPDNMPPVFLAACKDDNVVMFENSVRLDRALSEKNIPHEFAVFEKGGHGFGMKSEFAKKSHWNELLLQWLTSQGF